MSVALPDDRDLEHPEWIQCDDCEKWRNLPVEYVLTVRAWFFGSTNPTGFIPSVKQKPAGDLYVEYAVVCHRCGTRATLDRGPETLRDKERLLRTGKGNARSVEGWLREHQDCHADWSKLTPKSLSFKVPFGNRRFTSTKSPLYIPPARATSASSQSATSNLSTAATSSGQPSCGLAPPACASDQYNTTTNGPQAVSCMSRGLEQMPAPVKQDSGHLLSANPVCDALETPARLVQAAAGPSNAFAGAGLGPMAKYLEDPPVATAHMNETKPVLQPASQTMMKSDHKPHENAEWLPRPISRPPPFQVAAKRFKTYSSTCDNLANCTDSSQHVPQPKGVTAAGQTIPSLTPRDNEHQAAPPSVQNGCLQQLASQINTARSSPHCYLSKPKGMNGPLMSRPQKRKAVAAPVLSSTPSQAATASIDLTMSDDDIADTISNNDKQTEAAPQSALDPVSCTKSLALMVQVVNTNLKEKPILEEQLQRLQNAVDSVSELESLEPQELTDVLRSVGKLNTIQMIRVRQHLRSGL